MPEGLTKNNGENKKELFLENRTKEAIKEIIEKMEVKDGWSGWSGGLSSWIDNELKNLNITKIKQTGGGHNYLGDSGIKLENYKVLYKIYRGFGNDEREYSGEFPLELLS